MAVPEVRNPNRGIDKDHHLIRVRLRGVMRSFFSVPASFDNLLLLSWAIRACKPSLTRDVFSLIPVNLEASLSISSSILSVVLIHISMHNICIHVNKILTFFNKLGINKKCVQFRMLAVIIPAYETTGIAKT